MKELIERVSKRIHKGIVDSHRSDSSEAVDNAIEASIEEVYVYGHEEGERYGIERVIEFVACEFPDVPEHFLRQTFQ